MVEESSWPLKVSFSIFFLMFGVVYTKISWVSKDVINFFFDDIYMLVAMLYLFGGLTFWWKDVSVEGLSGMHPVSVQMSLKIGFMLFVVSEVMLFFVFFWSFFHLSFGSSFLLGYSWPPFYIILIHPFKIPALNTFLLLSSSIFVTTSHESLMTSKNVNFSQANLFVGMLLGFFFSMFQLYEYWHCDFKISSGSFGSIFYLTTGLHGFHVWVGIMFLFITFLRLGKSYFSSEHMVGLETSILYWHFVDVVWIFVYSWVYIWSWIK